MKQFTNRYAVPFVSTFALVLATFSTTAVGQDAEWEKVNDIPEKEYRLAGDGSGKLLPGVEFHKSSGKLSQSMNIRLERGQSLTLTAWTEEFQPVIMMLGAPVEKGTSAPGDMLFAGRKILHKSIHDEPRTVEERPLSNNYVTRFEFRVPDEGDVFTITVSSVIADNGTGPYSIEGAIWKLPAMEEEEDEDSAVVAGGAADLAKYKEKSGDQATGRNHGWWRNWADASDPTSKYSKSVASLNLMWLEAGDSTETLHKPGVAKIGSRREENIVKIEGGVYYFKPGTQDQIVIVVDADKEVEAAITISHDYKSLLPTLIQLAKSKMAEHGTEARKRP